MNTSSLVLAVVVLAAVASTRWFRLNVSPSVPYGLYRLTAVQGPLARGALVVLPVPAGYPCKPRHDLLATSVHLSWSYSIGLCLTSNGAA